MIKVCQYKAGPGQGERLVQLFQPGDMRAAEEFFSMGKTAAPMLPEVQQYLDGLKRQPNKIYVLVNALGAGEYWGSNINGDYFPEPALIHKGQDWGYESFYNAYPYKHHVNKDPSKSFGKVELAVWHDGMKRVELVVAIDRLLAKQHAAEDVVDKLDRGMFPDVSMGCVPKNTRILRASGEIAFIQDIKEGDGVLSHKGRKQRVISTMVRPHTGTIFNLKVFGHRTPLVLTGEHPLWLVRQEQTECRPSSKQVNRGRKQHVCAPGGSDLKKGCAACATVPKYKFNWVRTDEAREGDYLALPLPVFETQLKLTADQARLLGYYLAEGYVLKSKTGKPLGVEFCIGLHEIDVSKELNDLGDRLGFKDQIVERLVPARNGRYIAIWNSSVAEFCSGLCGSGAKTKKLSPDLMGADTDILSLFMGAYANGDGGCYKGSLYLSTASEELADQLRLVLARLGMVASVNEIVHKPSELVTVETVEYQVWVGTDTAWKLTTSRHTFGKSERQSSKRFFYEYDGVTYLMTPIESIEEESYDDNVYNFGVEEDNSYLVEGLAVHNCKVPYDLCSICTDWTNYHRAQSTFDPNVHKTVGMAVLAWHKRQPIRGVSVTRNDYCEHLQGMLNRILKDGRKVYAINDYPRFFDISFVFIGADKTAKVMAKLASVGMQGDVVPSWYIAEQLGYNDVEDEPKGRSMVGWRMEKAASVEGVRSIMAKKAAQKRAEIVKDVKPSQFGGKAVPAEDHFHPDLPNELLDQMGHCPLHEALSTPSTMGMVLKPREFQRIVIIRMGQKPLADELDRHHQVFSPSEETSHLAPVGGEHFSHDLMRLLLPFLESRSVLEPVAKRRVMKITITKGGPHHGPLEEVDDPFLQKVSSAYNGYLSRLGACLDSTPERINEDAGFWQAVYNQGLASEFEKEAGGGVDPKVIIGSVGAALLLSQLARQRKERAMMGKGEPTGLLNNTVADHPTLLAVLAGLGAMHQQGSDIPAAILAGIKGMGSRLFTK